MNATFEPTPAYPTEVVTQSRVRIVDLPLNAGRAALITLENGFDHTKPTTLGPAGVAAFNSALDEIAAMKDELVAVMVTGKPFIFAVGADLLGVGALSSREQALAIAKAGHDTFRRLGELGIPSFAFVNGAAMGGGVEIALHCDYRTVSSSAAALSLPEVFLGILPGWGGAYLLPNLIGPANAIKVIIENPMSQNKQLKPKDTLTLGIADVVLDPADFLSQSMLWAARVLTGEITVERAPIDQASWQQLVAGAMAQVDSRVHRATNAPYEALQLIGEAQSATRDAAFAAEDDALADLIMSEQFRASMYAFDLVQKRAKRPAGVPDKSLALPVNKVGIVGAGLMASQLALLFVRQLSVPVVMTDLDAERVAKGVGWVHQEIDTLAAKGRLSADKAARLKALVTGATEKSAFADADFVIEAVFEDMAVKRNVLAELEAVVCPTCILATNTSSLSVTDMSDHLAHPERVVGFHFFNPVAIMPLLEIARTPSTNDATLATAFAVGKQLKKSCVLVKDSPAFVVNRLLGLFMAEITRCVDEGTPFDVADAAFNPLGLPMTPFNLMALVGPGVAYHVSEIMNGHYPERFYVSENMKRLVDAKKTAIWTWDTGAPVLDPEVAELFSVGDTPSTEDQVRERTLRALANEIQLMLDEGVVEDVRDLDLCMLLGAGWPFWLGGITPYLDREGVSERVVGHRFLPAGVASLP